MNGTNVSPLYFKISQYAVAIIYYFKELILEDQNKAYER